MKVIGLTGGIGSGKSTVTDYLINKGYPVIDADLISHEITEKNGRAIGDIILLFGKEIIDEDGNLKRKKLANIVFNDENKKKQLEKVTTAVVIDIIKNQLSDLRNNGSYDIIFVDAPLLFESGADELTDLVWLVDANLDTRITRVMKRDNATYEQVLERIKHQMSVEEKKKKSTEILYNSRGKEDLYNQIETLLTKYD